MIATPVPAMVMTPSASDGGVRTIYLPVVLR